MMRSVLVFTCLVLPAIQGTGDEALLKALANSKHSLAEGIQQVTTATAIPISAKFEIEHDSLSLSVYTAGKGLGVDAEHNVLQEHAGNPEAAAWKPELELFADGEHIARSAQQLTLMALARSSLLDVVKQAEKSQSGTVYSITPVLRDRKALFVVLVAQNGRTSELVYDLLTGEPVKNREQGGAKK
jgi:hypothetical protein